MNKEIKCSCGSLPDSEWTAKDWKRKEEAVKNCKIHKGEDLKYYNLIPKR